MKRKWTHAVRYVLYSDLLEKFGPYDEWPGRRPVESKVFKEFLVKEAEHLNSVFPVEGNRKPFDASSIGQQIDWALSRTEAIAPTHVNSYMCNKVAAYEAGFITRTSLPQGMQVQYHRTGVNGGQDNDKQESWRRGENIPHSKGFGRRSGKE